MISVNFELAKSAYAKVLKYPYGGELEAHEYLSLRVFRYDLARAGMSNKTCSGSSSST